jgi:hypothetical protein
MHLFGSCARHSESTDVKSTTRLINCPMCQGEVFFIRHNGGSVWVDELGHPWPKHHCFLQRETQKDALDILRQESALIEGFRIGLVESAYEIKSGVVAKIWDGGRGSIRVILGDLSNSNPCDLAVTWAKSTAIEIADSEEVGDYRYFEYRLTPPKALVRLLDLVGLGLTVPDPATARLDDAGCV